MIFTSRLAKNIMEKVEDHFAKAILRLSSNKIKKFMVNIISSRISSSGNITNV
jgi:hypothetical protein